MSTSSGRKGACERCGHMLNEHAHPRDSKCKKCKKVFEICQVSIHGDGSQRAWRLCFIPCLCGKTHYPDKARAAVPLADHEYKPEHPGYRALDEEEYEEATSYHASVLPQDTRTTGHARVDSSDSQDPLAWSKEKYEQETRDIAELGEGLDKTHIGHNTKLKWSTWSWSKERKRWMRVREKSPGDWEYDYQALSGHWSEFSWNDAAGQYERAAKDPDGNWRYDCEPLGSSSLGSEPTSGKGKGKGKEMESDSTSPSTHTSLGPEYTSQSASGITTDQSASRDGLLVDTVKKEKNKHVFYHFRNEEGKEVQTKAGDWKKGSRYFEGTLYECLVYIGKTSGRVYYTWQLGTPKTQR
ncbi:unnamed protein product [Sphagnum balticum]